MCECGLKSDYLSFARKNVIVTGSILYRLIYMVDDDGSVLIKVLGNENEWSGGVVRKWCGGVVVWCSVVSCWPIIV